MYDKNKFRRKTLFAVVGIGPTHVATPPKTIIGKPLPATQREEKEVALLAMLAVDSLQERKKRGIFYFFFSVILKPQKINRVLLVLKYQVIHTIHYIVI